MMVASTAPRVPREARQRTPLHRTIVGVERMSRAFTKYHLDDGRALHRFRREEPDADPHDHPWAFETQILDGGYVEEVFRIIPGGGWRSECVYREPYTTHRVHAGHIRRIVALPQRECWTIVRAGPHERETRFWRFGQTIQSRAWHERKWSPHVCAALESQP